MTIRPATAKDSLDAASVVQSVYEEYGFTWDPAEYHADLYDLERFYLRPGHLFWIAELNPDEQLANQNSAFPFESRKTPIPRGEFAPEGGASVRHNDGHAPPSPLPLVGEAGEPREAAEPGEGAITRQPSTANPRQKVPVGTAALELFPPLPGDGLIETDGVRRIGGSDCALQRLYVRPEARILGVGTALMETVIAAARKAGRKRLEIWSDKRFESAHRLYFKLGAVQVGDRICHDPDHSPEWGLYIDI